MGDLPDQAERLAKRGPQHPYVAVGEQTWREISALKEQMRQLRLQYIITTIAIGLAAGAAIAIAILCAFAVGDR